MLILSTYVLVSQPELNRVALRLPTGTESEIDLFHDVGQRRIRERRALLEGSVHFSKKLWEVERALLEEQRQVRSATPAE